MAPVIACHINKPAGLGGSINQCARDVPNNSKQFLSHPQHPVRWQEGSVSGCLQISCLSKCVPHPWPSKSGTRLRSWYRKCGKMASACITNHYNVSHSGRLEAVITSSYLPTVVQRKEAFPRGVGRTITVLCLFFWLELMGTKG